MEKNDEPIPLNFIAALAQVAKQFAPDPPHDPTRLQLVCAAMPIIAGSLAGTQNGLTLTWRGDDEFLRVLATQIHRFSAALDEVEVETPPPRVPVPSINVKYFIEQKERAGGGVDGRIEYEGQWLCQNPFRIAAVMLPAGELLQLWQGTDLQPLDDGVTWGETGRVYGSMGWPAIGPGTYVRVRSSPRGSATTPVAVLLGREIK